MVATYRKVNSLKPHENGLNVITNNIVEAMDAVVICRFTVRTDININTTEGWGNEHSYLS